MIYLREFVKLRIIKKGFRSIVIKKTTHSLEKGLDDMQASDSLATPLKRSSGYPILNTMAAPVSPAAQPAQRP